jgi:serine/threonine-protein kinase HipA
MVFNVLVSNVDDHLRNHGFLWLGKNGWSLSPAYDLNPTPTDLKARILTTNIDLDEGTCSLDLVESVAEFFGITLAAARNIIREVGAASPTGALLPLLSACDPRKSTEWPALSSTTT